MQITPDDTQTALTPLDDYTPQATEKNGRFQHLVKYCIDLYDRAKRSDYRENKLQEIKESYEAYEQKKKATSDPWEGASNLILPLTTISVDNLEPRIVAGLIGKRPFVKFEMESEQQPPEDVQLVEAWYNNELEEQVRIERAGREIAHSLLLEGTVYPIAAYDTEERKIRDFATVEDAQQMPEIAQGLQPAPAMDPATGQMAINPMSGQPVMQPPGLSQIAGVIVDAKTGEPVVIEKVEQLFEGGKVEYAEFNDVYVPDDAEDWEQTPVIRMVYKTYAELMQAAAGNHIGYIKDNIGPWLCREKTGGRLGDDQQTVSQEVAGVEISKEVIPCLECSIRYIYRPEENTEEKDIRDFTEERVVALIAKDKKILIRLSLLRELNWKNEHLIKRVRMFPERGRAYGTPIATKTKSIQEGASKTFNMAVNIAELVLIPWFFYSNRAGLKLTGKLSPGLGVECDDPTAIVFPKFNINPDQMFQYLSIWEGYFERIVSIGDLQVGRTADDKTTATEVMAVLEEGNVKHNYQVTTMRSEFISLFVSIYDLYYQHMPLNKTFLYNGQQVPIPRAAMRRPFRFKLTGSTDLSNKLIDRKVTEDFFKMVLQDPTGIFNPITPREDLCRSYGRTDVGRYIDPQVSQIVAAIKTIPGAAQLFQQAMAQAQELAALAQGGGQPPGAGPPQAPQQGGPPQ